ncbi:MAG: hypothetical protein Q9175_006399 [Cornicularia normoerica]
MALAFLVVLYTYLRLAAALSKEGWRSQSIYQLLTDRYARTNGSEAPCSDLGNYCGGSWQGITNNLDYIQNMGFTAIWISPITENIPDLTYEGAAYHGFWPQKINQVNSNFGTAADLKALSNALHQRGMYLMVDMVTNDMAWNGNHTTVDYSVYDVFNDPSYFHPYCPITDYQNSTNAVECWSGDDHISLPDLAIENATVLNKWEAWVSNITATYGIDGIRLDACLEQDQQFFTPFETAAGVYIICEAYDYPIDVVCGYQKYVSGLLNFPVWYLVIDAFGSISGSITNLYNGITEMQGNCTDVSLLGNFVENHDVNRLPYTVSDPGLNQNAIAFVMLNDGIPIIYAGEEQYYSGGSPPADRETTWTSGYNTSSTYYQLVQKINQFRTCAIGNDATYLTTKSVPFFLDTQVIGVKKGSSPATQVVGVYNNRGTGAEAYTINMANTGWTAGDVVYEIYTEQAVTVDAQGELPVYITHDHVEDCNNANRPVHFDKSYFFNSAFKFYANRSAYFDNSYFFFDRDFKLRTGIFQLFSSTSKLYGDRSTRFDNSYRARIIQLINRSFQLFSCTFKLYNNHSTHFDSSFFFDRNFKLRARISQFVDRTFQLFSKLYYDRSTRFDNSYRARIFQFINRSFQLFSCTFKLYNNHSTHFDSSYLFDRNFKLRARTFQLFGRTFHLFSSPSKLYD